MMPGTIPVRLLTVSLAVNWIAGLSGCSITRLQHDELQEPAYRQSGTVNVEPRATGSVGKWQGTLGEVL
jgi:hypothetical protein